MPPTSTMTFAASRTTRSTWSVLCAGAGCPCRWWSAVLASAGPERAVGARGAIRLDAPGGVATLLGTDRAGLSFAEDFALRGLELRLGECASAWQQNVESVRCNLVHEATLPWAIGWIETPSPGELAVRSGGAPDYRLLISPGWIAYPLTIAESYGRDPVGG